MAQTRVTPQEAWDTFIAGNERFISSESSHPNQDVERRTELANTQAPDVALFGCSDSRLAAEIIFDCGLGDLFIARNMGHVVAESIVASMEYAVAELGTALIVVLAHDSCGAVAAAYPDLALWMTDREVCGPCSPRRRTPRRSWSISLTQLCTSTILGWRPRSPSSRSA